MLGVVLRPSHRENGAADEDGCEVTYEEHVARLIRQREAERAAKLMNTIHAFVAVYYIGWHMHHQWYRKPSGQ